MTRTSYRLKRKQDWAKKNTKTNNKYYYKPESITSRSFQANSSTYLMSEINRHKTLSRLRLPKYNYHKVLALPSLTIGGTGKRKYLQKTTWKTNLIANYRKSPRKTKLKFYSKTLLGCNECTRKIFAMTKTTTTTNSTTQNYRIKRNQPLPTQHQGTINKVDDTEEHFDEMMKPTIDLLWKLE